MGDPQNGWFIMEHPNLKRDDLGLPPFMETPMWLSLFVCWKSLGDRLRLYVSAHMREPGIMYPITLALIFNKRLSFGGNVFI